jgi:hypothetical protein
MSNTDQVSAPAPVSFTPMIVAICAMAAVTVAAGGAITHFMLGGLRGDVSSIRATISALQAGEKDAVIRLHDAEAKAHDRNRDSELKAAEQFAALQTALQNELVALGGTLGDVSNA